MRIHIDVRDDIPYPIALECVEKVVLIGKVSACGNSYCYAMSFTTSCGDVMVETRQYRKSDCFLVYKNKKHDIQLNEECFKQKEVYKKQPVVTRPFFNGNKK